MLISKETKFRGRVVEVNVETVQLPNGVRTVLDVVHHPGGAAIAAVDAADRVCLLHQFRHAAGGRVWELPAGKLEPGEPPQATAQREIIEEAGVFARSWCSLGTCISSPGVFTEVVHLFLATDLEAAVANPEQSEVFEVHWVPLPQACARALAGDLLDAKTCIGLLRAAERLRQKP